MENPFVRPRRALLTPGAFLERADEEVERALRYDRVLSVALVAVDGFGALRTAAGPGGAEGLGDALARRLQAGLRRTDRIARLGPAQFGVLMPETRISLAAEVLERLSRDVAAEGWEIPGGRAPMALSVGLAAVSIRLREARRLLMAACLELRRARNKGGGRICAIPAERVQIMLPRSAEVH